MKNMKLALIAACVTGALIAPSLAQKAAGLSKNRYAVVKVEYVARCPINHICGYAAAPIKEGEILLNPPKEKKDETYNTFVITYPYISD